jgi:hypothetical protein
LKNCYVSSFDAEILAKNLEAVLVSQVKSNGRDAVYAQKLDNDSVALKIIDIYKSKVK